MPDLMTAMSQAAGTTGVTRDIVGGMVSSNPLGAANALSPFNTVPQAGLGNTGTKTSLWGRLNDTPGTTLSYVLGKTAQAIAGRWQDAPFAQVGAVGADIAQKKAADVTLKKVLAGEPLESISEASILGGEETRAILNEARMQETARVENSQKRVNLIKSIKEMPISLSYQQALVDDVLAGVPVKQAQTENLKATTGFTKRQTELLKDPEYMKKLDIAGEAYVQGLRNKGAIDVANLNMKSALEQIKLQYGNNPYAVHAATLATQLAANDVRTAMSGEGGDLLDQNALFTDSYNKHFKEIYASQVNPEGVDAGGQQNNFLDALFDPKNWATPGVKTSTSKNDKTSTTPPPARNSVLGTLGGDYLVGSEGYTGSIDLVMKRLSDKLLSGEITTDEVSDYLSTLDQSKEKGKK